MSKYKELVKLLEEVGVLQLDDDWAARIQDLVKKHKKETNPGCHWACTGCDVCGSAGHGNSWN